MLIQLWNARKNTLSNGGTSAVNSTNGLNAISGLLGEAGLAALEAEVMGLGDFEAGGQDDINGLLGEAEDIELTGLESLESLGDYLNPNANTQSQYNDGYSGYNGYDDNESTLAVIYGLGKVRKARVRKRPGSSSAANTASATNPNAASTSNATTTTSSEKNLGLYIPLNTMRNLFKLRTNNYYRLRDNGHKVSPGEVPVSRDTHAIAGIEDTGYETADGLGWALIKKLADKSANIIRQAAPIAAFVPGASQLVAVQSSLDKGKNLLQRLNPKPAASTNSNNTNSNNAYTTANTNPNAYTNAGNPNSPSAQDSTEAIEAYNRNVDVNGLNGVSLSGVAEFVKENPIATVLGVGVVGIVAYQLWPKGKSGKGKGSKRKKELSGSSTTNGKSAKRRKRKHNYGKVQEFTMTGLK